MQMRNAGLLSVAVLVCGCLGVTPMRGQVRDPGDIQAQRGLAPSGTYNFEELETVNPTTGALFLKIPLAQLPPNRGGDPGFALSLAYNSGIYNVTSALETEGEVSDVRYRVSAGSGGWSYNTSYQLLYELRPVYFGTCSPDNIEIRYRNRLTLLMPDGSRHLLRMHGQYDNNGDGYYEYDPKGVASTHPLCQHD